jgi:hypothetical protein
VCSLQGALSSRPGGLMEDYQVHVLHGLTSLGLGTKWRPPLCSDVVCLCLVEALRAPGLNPENNPGRATCRQSSYQGENRDPSPLSNPQGESHALSCLPGPRDRAVDFPGHHPAPPHFRRDTPSPRWTRGVITTSPSSVALWGAKSPAVASVRAGR